ncbi:Basement membrane-specific heparan sulfate proteoglycan core protein [Desmophyllum pertusum]|uniref:Basement membrane-specific heparan sulfate proteoglycan core protein n=1 Tax=Desmophyllum pertusum TaxID=174260 RepID=A0A9W9YHA6_9CNID|nr:Basement membrane-specific heparan sulfate proteoglycan core protein [Desmophyllum pertusum]
MWPDLRTNSRQMIVFISIGDFLVAGSNIIGLYAKQMCNIQATINIAAVLSSFFWTVYLSVYFYLTICKQISMWSERLAMYLFHITAWGIPLAIAIAAYVEGAVGSSEDYVSSGWCWIKYTHSGKRWKMVLWMCIAGKGWEILAYIAITVFYVLVKFHIRRELKMGFVPGSHFLTQRSVEVAKRAEYKLTFIPVVFILLRIWGTIRFFRFLADYPNNPSALDWLVILQVSTDHCIQWSNLPLYV